MQHGKRRFGSLWIELDVASWWRKPVAGQAEVATLDCYRLMSIKMPGFKPIGSLVVNGVVVVVFRCLPTLGKDL